MFTRRVVLSSDEYHRLKDRIQIQFISNDSFRELFYDWFDNLPVDLKQKYWDDTDGKVKAEQAYLDLLFDEYAKEKGIYDAKELARHAQGASRFY